MEKLIGLILTLLVLTYSYGAMANTQLDIKFDADKLRTAWVDLPNNYTSLKKYPVVIMLHGGGGNGEQARKMTGFDDIGDHEGFITVYPYGHPTVGLSVFRSDSQEAQSMIWAGGPCCGEGIQDDVRFLDVMLTTVIRTYNADKKRIYMVGHGNGGMMAYRYVCAHPEKIAALAVNSGPASFVKCDKAKRPVPILNLHGTSDECIRMGVGESCKSCVSRLIGGPVMYGKNVCKPVGDTLKVWADQYECVGQPAPKMETDLVECTVWDQCKGGTSITACSVKGGGHNWPGGNNDPELCKIRSPQRCEDWTKMVGPVSEFGATRFIWEFLKSHQLP